VVGRFFQVPWLLWSSLRVGLSLVGLMCLYQLALSPHGASNALIAWYQGGYHLFSTTPLVLQALFQVGGAANKHIAFCAPHSVLRARRLR
jgi:hypothetical protein